jgi:aryl-alcohol dehydrogenase-like predicted oxidoreductase
MVTRERRAPLFQYLDQASIGDERRRHVFHHERQPRAMKGGTAAHVALAGLLARGPSIVPIFGTRRLDRVKENLGAAEVSLSDEDMTAIEARLGSIEVTGERLPPAILKLSYR